jgi:RimJ/RimL family protein N-acetyltransferase
MLTFSNGYIRVAQPNDAPTLASWWADGKVMEHAGFPNGIKTDINQLKNRLSTQKTNSVLWILEDINHSPIGEMAFSIKDLVATLGIKICVSDAQNKGVGKQALKCMINHLFETYNIESIWLDTMIENKRAQHVYESLNFEQIKINQACWEDQLGNIRTAVEYSLNRNTYNTKKAFYENH